MKLLDLVVVGVAAETLRRYIKDEAVGEPVRELVDRIDDKIWLYSDDTPRFTLGGLLECDVCFGQWCVFAVVVGWLSSRTRWLVEALAVNGASWYGLKR